MVQEPRCVWLRGAHHDEPVQPPLLRRRRDDGQVLPEGRCTLLCLVHLLVTWACAKPALGGLREAHSRAIAEQLLLGFLVGLVMSAATASLSIGFNEDWRSAWPRPPPPPLLRLALPVTAGAEVCLDSWQDMADSGEYPKQHPVVKWCRPFSKLFHRGDPPAIKLADFLQVCRNLKCMAALYSQVLHQLGHIADKVGSEPRKEGHQSKRGLTACKTRHRQGKLHRPGAV